MVEFSRRGGRRWIGLREGHAGVGRVSREKRRQSAERERGDGVDATRGYAWLAHGVMLDQHGTYGERRGC